MSPYSILPFLNGTYILVLGLFVYSKQKTILGKTILALCVSVFVWLVGYAAMYSITSEKIALILARFLYIGVIFIPTTYHHFTMRFLDLKDTKKFIIFSYVVSLIFVIYDLFTNNFVTGLYKYFYGWHTKTGGIQPLYLIWAIAIYIKCLIALFRRGYLFIDERSAGDKSTSYYTRVRYAFWAYLFGNLGSIDYLCDYGLEIYPLGGVLISIFTTIMVIAIVKHQLLEIEVII